MFIQINYKDRSDLIDLCDVSRICKTNNSYYGENKFYILIYLRNVVDSTLCFDTESERDKVFNFIVEKINVYNQLKYPLLNKNLLKGSKRE